MGLVEVTQQLYSSRSLESGNEVSAGQWLTSTVASRYSLLVIVIFWLSDLSLCKSMGGRGAGECPTCLPFKQVCVRRIVLPMRK